MKTVWVKETPKVEGWFWIKYRTGRSVTKCPCAVVHFKDGGTLVHTARNTSFMEGPHHGGPGLKYNGTLDKSIRFGPQIDIPPG